MPIIESALGVIKSFEIATAADNVVALAIGLEDSDEQVRMAAARAIGKGLRCI